MDNIILTYTDDYIISEKIYPEPSSNLDPIKDIVDKFNSLTDNKRYDITKIVEDNLYNISDRKLEDISELLKFFINKYNYNNINYDTKLIFFLLSIYSSLPELEFGLENINKNEEYIGIMKQWRQPYEYIGKIINYKEDIIYENVRFNILNNISSDKDLLKKYKLLKEKQMPLPYISYDFVYGGKTVIVSEIMDTLVDLDENEIWIMISDISDILKKLNEFCIIENLTHKSISKNNNSEYGYDFIISDYRYISTIKNNKTSFKGKYSNVYSDRKEVFSVTKKDQILNLINVAEALSRDENKKLIKFKEKMKKYKYNNIHDYAIKEALRMVVI